MESAARRTAITFNHLQPNLTSSTGNVVTVSKDSNSGVATITLNNPPVNSISDDLMIGLEKALKECYDDQSTKAIVLTGANNKFCGGAEISNFEKRTPSQTRDYVKQGNGILNALENGPKPVVAAISSFALGGGLEIAMACHARVVTEKCSLGLPELTLGLIPGFGGTQRLPRLVGVQKSVEMMLQSKPVSAQDALKLGLADLVVPPSQLLAKSVQLSLSLVNANLRRSLKLTEKLGDEKSMKDIIAGARKASSKNSFIYHPSACLNAVEHGVLSNGYSGLERETEEFIKCLEHPASKALIHVFFSSKATTKVPGVTNGNLKPRKISKAAVLGGGTMGSGIATALLLSGIHTILKEVNQSFLDAGVNRIKGNQLLVCVINVKDNLQRRVQAKRMTNEQYEKVLSLLQPQLTYDNFQTLDIVIEAVIEDIPLKQQIFVDLEKVCNSSCILASNTSTIDLNIIGAKTKSQNRIIGTHFFSPAHIMNLLEVVRTEATSPQVVLDIIELSKVLNKTPIVVGNCIGFTVNRMFFPYTQSAVFLVERGIDLYRIDKLLEKFGMPMGVFKMTDLAGVDVCSYVGNITCNGYPDRVYRTTLLDSLAKEKRFGQKSGSGFYKYEKRSAVPDPEALKSHIESARKSAGNPGNIELSDSEIVEFILYSVVNEALRILDEGMVVRGSDIDIGALYGYGFPAYRGGPLKWAELEGYKKVATKLDNWYKLYNLPVLKPCPYLLKLADSK